jgi:hypothetical protein
MKMLAVLVAVALGSPAIAQDEEEGSVDIGDVGSSRIGGPGLTERERAYNSDEGEEEEYVTEDTLPPVGHKKRLPSLHKLARQYFGGQQWKDACEKYDTIVAEAGMEGLETVPEAKGNAGRAYLECGRIAFQVSELDKAEKLLDKSAKLIPSDHRHDAIRRKMLRETYRKKVSDGDIGNAVKLFDQYQAQEKDDDERIWFGERLAERMTDAHKQKDEITRNEMMGYLARIAPMNTDYRRLEEEIDSRGTVLQEAFMFAAAIVGFIVLWTVFTKWRERAKIGSAGSKNKFDMD